MRHLALILVAGLALSACGEAARPASEPRVRLKLDLPEDGGQVRAQSVAVRGTVTPADAAVRVAGADTQVDAGEFTATVALRPGGNVIDITATAPGRRPAADAVRITRDIRVAVPSVVGLELSAATGRLRQRGLKTTAVDDDNWLERVLGGEVNVCSAEPGAGVLVLPRSAVTLHASRSC